MASAVVNWEYYSSLHNKVSSTDFAKAESIAEKEVMLVVGYPRWAALDDEAWYYGQLKDCICNTIDLMKDIDSSAVGKGVSSVSNDGYSESYTMQTNTQVKADLQSSIRSWLSGTGLAGAY